MKSPEPHFSLTRFCRDWTLLSLFLLIVAGCASLPPNTDRKQSFAYPDTVDTSLGKLVAADTNAHPGQSGFYLLPRGLDAFAARAALAYQAERSIDAQYYLLHSDLAGKLFLHALLQAAERGVRVRLLIDDMALSSDRDIGAAALDAHPNFEIRVFNPFGRNTSRALQFLTRFGEVTRRMHNKSFTVDGQVSILGGRNIGNEYFDADPTVAFADLDVMTVGPVVDEISSAFDLYWNSAASYPVATLVGDGPGRDLLAEATQFLDDYARKQRDSIYLTAVRESAVVDSMRDWRFDFDWGDARILYDNPAKIAAARNQQLLNMSAQLRLYTTEAETELLIISPYFVPGREGVANLVALAERGVQVRIVTNSLASTDVGAVHAGYSKYRKYLLRAGIELFEIDRTLSRAERKEKKGSGGSNKASLHAKTFIIDRQQVFIGSLNLDPRSIVENTEIGILLESPDVAVQIGDWFDQIAQHAAFRLALEQDRRGDEVIRWYRQRGDTITVYDTEPNAGFWRRFGVGLLKLLPIESQL